MQKPFDARIAATMVRMDTVQPLCVVLAAPDIVRVPGVPAFVPTSNPQLGLAWFV